MGTKVHCESYLPGYHSMRDPNEGSSSSNWPLLCSDKSIANGQYQNGYLARTFPNSYPGGDKDAVKQKMLEQDAVFQHQVIELHRLYNTQKDMMGEIKRIELHKQRMLIETSSSSGPLMYQKSKFAYLNPNPGIEMNSPPSSSARGNINQVSEPFLAQNGCSSLKKDYEVSEVRPSKVRKKLSDLQLPPNEDDVDPEEDGRAHNKFLEVSSRNHRISSPDMATVSKYNKETTYISSSRLRNPAVDLNEPVQLEEPPSPSPHFLLGLSKEVLNNPKHPSGKGISSCLHIENRGSGKDRLFYTYQGNNKTNMNIISQDAQRESLLVSHKPLENAALDKYRHPSTTTVNGFAHVTIDYLRERLEASNRDPCNMHHLKPVSTFANKMASIQTRPHLNPLGTSNTSSQSSAQQSQQEISNRGPLLPSWIKDPSACFPLTGFENFNSNKYANERSINYSPSKMVAKDVNLNLCPPSKNPCIEIVDVEKDYVDQTIVLPWLKTETQKRSNQFPPPDNKIFGVPIFAQSSCCTTTTKDCLSLASTSAPLKDKGKRLMIDMNIACDIECDREIVKERSPPPIIEKSVCEKEKEPPLFDLNAAVGSEDETTAVALVLPSTVSTNNNERIMIDLEMPPVPESDEEDVLAPPVEQEEQPRDKEEVLIAAEAMMAISSYLTTSTNIPLVFEAPSPDPLLWFAEVVSSLVVVGGGFENLEIDEFEASTLNLREMPEEEYMPKPPLEDIIPNLDENAKGGGASSSARGGRTRRGGGGRRGTRKRDFQRDILPGLVSLSRHEVSEDIQALGLTRRNRNRGGGRGRRRITMYPPADDVAQTAAVCPSLTEAANLWGETPRRPRRQRGNS